MNPNKNVTEAAKLDISEETSAHTIGPIDSSVELSILQCLDFLDELDIKEVEITAGALQKSFYNFIDEEMDYDFDAEAMDDDSEDKELGCKHYKTNCKFMAECCKKWYPCRFCHNEVSNHEVDRFKTRFCMCMFCNTVQRAGKTCINTSCGKDLAHHYCDHCKFWDNDVNKKIFHCDKCGVCRNGLRENYIHCDKCNACLATEYHKNHKCIERSLECDCPICGEYLFTTIAPIIFMPCGHGIHFLCHRDHLQSSYQCPICLKSVTDMSHFFNQIDMMLANHQMPPEYNQIKSLVLCNDCEKKSIAPFHFVYHKCNFCKSYNTKLMKTFNEDEMEPEEIESEDVSIGEEMQDDTDASNLNKEGVSPHLEP